MPSGIMVLPIAEVRDWLLVGNLELIGHAIQMSLSPLSWRIPQTQMKPTISLSPTIVAAESFSILIFQLLLYRGCLWREA